MVASNLKIVCVQINPKVGDLAHNAATIIKHYHRAASDGADLVIFPEHALTGYPLEDLVLQSDFLTMLFGVIHSIVKKVDGRARLVLGTPFCDRDVWEKDRLGLFGGAQNMCAVRTKQGYAIFNSALVIENGHIVHVVHKRCLPNRGIFDEKRYYQEGPKSEIYHFAGHDIGFLICDDLWYPEVAMDLKHAGASILISLNGSPYTAIKSDERRTYVTARIKETGLPFVFLNLVGAQDEVVFDGGSFVMDYKGALLDQATFWEEDSVSFIVKEGGVIETSHHRPYEQRPAEEKNYSAMVLGLKDFVEKNGIQTVLMGLSGGIDSALTAAVAVDALGCDRVKVCFLPTQYTSQESWEDGLAIVEMLGVKHDVIDVEPLVLKTLETLNPFLAGTQADTTEENVQARLRGLLLMALSNKFGALLLTTGNKSEVAVGYCTMYGDMAGGFNVLKDLYKTEVFAVSAWRCGAAHLPLFYQGRVGRVMPQRVIEKAPSAELRHNQKDEDTLPAYPILDAILQKIIDERKHLDAIIAEGYDKETVLWIYKRLKGAEYKRFQAAPGVKLSKVAFGRDWRYPLVNGFDIDMSLHLDN